MGLAPPPGWVIVGFSPSSQRPMTFQHRAQPNLQQPNPVSAVVARAFLALDLLRLLP